VAGTKKNKKKLTEAEAVARGGRVIRAIVLDGEHDAAADPDAPAQNDAATEHDAAAQNDAPAKDDTAADGEKSMTGRERTQRYRKSWKGRAQLNVVTTDDPDKRSTLQELAKKLIKDPDGDRADNVSDAVHSVCKLVVQAGSEVKTLDAMCVAGDAPYVVNLGILAAHKDVRPAVDAVIGNAELRTVVAACSADGETCGRVVAIVRNPIVLKLSAAIADNVELRECLQAAAIDAAFLSLCSSIRQNPLLRQAAQAAQANPKIAEICVQLATSAPSAVESVVAAIKRPRATELGYRIISLGGMRGSILRKLVVSLLWPGSSAS
jgi:hypothetical protein